MADTILSTLLIPVLEVASDRMVHSDGIERMNYWDAFKQLFETFPHKNLQYGRIYNRFWMCQILGALTQAQCSAQGPPIDGETTEFPNRPLAEWSEGDWEALGAHFDALTEGILRLDADASPFDAENSHVHEDRANGFANKIEKVRRYIKVYAIISPIRALIMQQVEDKKIEDDSYPELDKKLVANLWAKSLDEKDDAIRDQLIRKLFHVDEVSDRLQKNNPSKLRTIGELRIHFRQKPFTFEKFPNRVDILMSDWCLDVFEEPRLNSFYFPDEVVEEDAADILRRLREARNALGREGRDPLSESIRIANAIAPARRSSPPPRGRTRSRTPRSGGLYKRKASARSLTFDESQDVITDPDDPKGDGGTRQLSALPPRATIGDGSDEENTPSKKARKSQAKKYEGRRAWTSEEKTAITEGVRELGLGKWAEIKKRFALLLEYRTSGQIKDCFRTMVKKEEVPSDLLPTE